MQEVTNTPVEEKVESSSMTSTIFNFLYRHLVFILICVVLGGILGIGANRLFHKTTYTASIKVMFMANITNTGSEGSVETTTTDVSLAKLYLPETSRLIKSADFASAATKIYKANYDANGSVNAKNIKVEYSENILIFVISYTDYSATEAINKLKAVEQSAKENLPKSIQAKDVTIKATQSEDSITAGRSRQLAVYVLVGAFIGMIGAMIKLFISYSLDNSVKSKEELEKITGASLIAIIDNREELVGQK